MEKTIEIPAGISVEKKGSLLEVKGPNGSLSRQFNPQIKLSIQDNLVKISTNSERKKAKALVGTWTAHVKNMIQGVSSGFSCELRIIYSHFPIKATVEGDTFVVQNFLGERSSRKTKIPPGVKIEISKTDVIISGPDKEEVGQAAGRIEAITKVTRFDRRIFQDGIHLVSKAKPMKIQDSKQSGKVKS